MSASAITLRDLTFEWPDGTVALDRVSGTFTTGRTGLVGRNGAGKSTLLRLIAGLLRPTSGRVDTVGEVGYLPQTLTTRKDSTVAELLGVDRIVAALRAIESGDPDPRHFDTVGDDWDIEARAEEALHEIGFTTVDLDRRVDTLSGGEAMLIAITGLRVRRTPVTLLDEPTNNLDRPTRARLAEMIDNWTGTLVVVSHDLELLEHMDATAELHDSRIEVFGGPYSAWKEHREQEQAAAVQAARSATRRSRSRSARGSKPRRSWPVANGRRRRPRRTAVSRRSSPEIARARRRLPRGRCAGRSTTRSRAPRPRPMRPPDGFGKTSTSISRCPTRCASESTHRRVP